MRVILILSLFSAFSFSCSSTTIENTQPVNENPVPVVANIDYPWKKSEDCQLRDYGASGVPSVLQNIMEQLSLTHRITQGINYSAKASNYHGPDAVENGGDVSFAIDLSIKCLKPDEIIALLELLAQNNIIAWYRLRGVDGWPKDEEEKYLNHIHAVYVKGTLKPQLAAQVQAWLDGKNGLTTNLPYSYWSPSHDIKNKIRDLL